MLVLIPLGAFVAGFVAGMAGFGTALVALSFWLHVLTPTVAAPLVVLCSVSTHLQTLKRIITIVDWRLAVPFIVPGLLGVPLGVMALSHVEPRSFRFAVGVFLIAYALFMLAGGSRLRVRWGGRVADALVGFISGIFGGLAGLSGALPSVWGTLRGWTKAEARGVFQMFNMSVLGFAILSYGVDGLIDRHVGLLFALALPANLIGSWLGHRTYWAVNEVQFRLAVLWLLLFAGIMLVAAP